MGSSPDVSFLIRYYCEWINAVTNSAQRVAINNFAGRITGRWKWSRPGTAIRSCRGEKKKERKERKACIVARFN